MKDFNGVEINVGTKVFFMHSPSQPVIGRVSEIGGKKTFTVLYKDVIKTNKKGHKEIEDYREDNPELDTCGFVVNSDKCSVIVPKITS